MVTGNILISLNAVQKISLSEIAIAAIEKYILSIDLRIDGLSFLVRDEQKELIHMEYFEWLNVKNWTKTKENLSILLSEHEILKLQFNSVQVYIQSTDSFLVPDSVFSKDDINTVYATYFGNDNHTLFFQKMKSPAPEAQMIFGMDQEIAQLINTKWKSVSWHHYSFFYINQCLQGSSQKQEVFVKLQNNYFEVIALKNQVLNSHNYFQFSSAEEFIFNLLSYIRQIGFDIKEVQLHLEGKITTSSTLHQLVKKYVPHLQLEAHKGEKPEDAFQDLIQAVNYAHS